jgi:hypothetical protein
MLNEFGQMQMLEREKSIYYYITHRLNVGYEDATYLWNAVTVARRRTVVLSIVTLYLGFFCGILITWVWLKK